MVDGTEAQTLPANNKFFTLKELHRLVGGLIEYHALPSGRVLIMNEEGRLKNLPRNDAATRIWCDEYPIEKYPENNSQLVVGDVILFESDDVQLQLKK